MKKGKILSLVLALAVTAGAMAIPAKAVSPAEEAAGQMEKCAQFVENSDAALDDWNVFAVARGTTGDHKALFTAYYEDLAARMNDPEVKFQCSDDVRSAVTLTSIGIDPRNVEGIDLLKRINEAGEEEYLGMSTSSLAYGIALIKRYPESFSNALLQKTADQILAAQQLDGSFEYLVGSGYGGDPDSTAQAIQGLALLGDQYTSQIQKATALLKASINNNGAILNFGSANPSSTAQALIAFSQLNENPASAQGKTLYDGLKSFLLPDHSFQDLDWNTGEMAYNAFTTSQGIQGVAAYHRMLSGLTPLFDLSDVSVAPAAKPGDEPASSQEPSSSEKPSSSQAPSSSEPAAVTSSSAGDLNTPKTGDTGVAAILVTASLAAAAVWMLRKNEKNVY